MDDLWYYYCGGSRIVELIVALHSLRKHHSGRIAIALDPKAAGILPRPPTDVEVVVLSNSATTAGEHLANRWRGLTFLSYDRVIVSDIDVIVQDSVRLAFEAIDPDPKILTTFGGFQLIPLQNYRARALKAIEHHCRDLDTLIAREMIYVTMGLFGVHRGYPLIDEMIRLCPLINREEYSINYLMEKHGRAISYPRHPDGRPWIAVTRARRANPLLWHAIKGRFRTAKQWRRAWYSVRNENFMGMQDSESADRLEGGISRW